MRGIEELRQGVAADAAAIRELTRAAYAKWVPLIGREPKPMTINYDEALRKHRFDLLDVSGKLAALIETAQHADHLLIVNVAVTPALQGQGLGTKLMAHAETLAAAAGLSVLKLFTNKSFAENIALYKKLGYGVDREEDFRGRVAVHMSKLIRS
jgi:ribosomal protein S18 acetylase RimI-like enzyme